MARTLLSLAPAPPESSTMGKSQKPGRAIRGHLGRAAAAVRAAERVRVGHNEGAPPLSTGTGRTRSRLHAKPGSDQAGPARRSGCEVQPDVFADAGCDVQHGLRSSGSGRTASQSDALRPVLSREKALFP